MKIPVVKAKKNKKKKTPKNKCLDYFNYLGKGIFNLGEPSGSKRRRNKRACERCSISRTSPDTLRGGTLNKHLLNKWANHFPMSNAH